MKSVSRTPWNSVEARGQLAAWITRRFFVRFHVLLILVCTALIGVGANKLLLQGFDLFSPLFRYPLVVCVSYLAFLLFIRLWLWYAGFDRHYRKGDSEDVGIDGFGGGNAGDVPLTGHGGEFGGGGASGDWSPSGTLEQTPGLDFHAPDIPSVDLGDVGGDEGCLIVVIPLLAIALLMAFFAGAFYFLSYSGPLMLAEAALEGALAAGFWGSMRRIQHPGWAGGALQASWHYFGLVFVLSIFLGLFMHHFYPGVHTLGQIF